MKRKILVGLALAGLFLLVVTARVLYSSRKEYLRGRQAAEMGRLDMAIVHYRRAAHWYAPGNPYVTSSLDALWNIADQAEGAGRIPLALAAYRAIRSSILGTRSFYTPHADRLAKVNPRIAALMARQELQRKAEARRRAAARNAPRAGTTVARSSSSRSKANGSKTAPSKKRQQQLTRSPSTRTVAARPTAPTSSARHASGRSAPSPATLVRSGSARSATKSSGAISSSPATDAPRDSATAQDTPPQPLDPAALERLRRKHLELLNKTNMPSVGWSLLAILGLAFWVGGAFAFAYKAVTYDDRLDGRKAVFWGSFVLLGLVLWVLGLALA